jgi:hypothetical protein
MDVAIIEQALDGLNLFTVTAKNLSDVARIRAKGRASMLSPEFNAELIVTVVDKPSAETVGSRALLGIKDFEDGLVSGLAAITLRNAKMVIEKVVREPENFGLGFLVGYHKGLLDGLRALLKSLGEDGIIGMIKKPPEARRAAVALLALIAEVEADSDEILGANAGASGKKLGEAIAAALTDEIANKPTREIGEWVGAIVGAVAFEIILIVVTDGVGEAVKVARAAPEIQQLVARLRPVLENLLGGLVKLKSSFRARLGMRAAEEIGEVVPALREYVNLNTDAKLEEIGLGKFLDELAQRNQLGQIKRVRGMPEVEGAASPDYHLFFRAIENTELRNGSLAADLRGEAVIPDGNNINNIISNAIGDKAKRQADAIFIEIGSKGSSGQITDAAVKAWKVEDVAPMSPSLRRLMVIRNSGGARRIVLDLLIR